MKLKDWLFLSLIIILFGISMFYPKQKEQSNSWQECYSISFINNGTTKTYLTSTMQNEYLNKSIKVRFDDKFCYVKIHTWRDTEENLTILRETANMVINYK